MKKLILAFFIVTSSVSCTIEEVENTESNLKENYFQVTGKAQGTTYSIIYNDSLNRDLSFQIDSLLVDYDRYLSVYLDSSIISKFNSSKSNPSFTTVRFRKDSLMKFNLFEECFTQAKNIYFHTDGAFNPAIYPLVKYWGFFDENLKENYKQEEIDSILKLVNFEDSLIHLVSDTNSSNEIDVKTAGVWKKYGSIKIDFNAIAQGHSVDVLGRYLESLMIKNYMVEIGGEVLCSGENNQGKVWQIGIDKPVDNSSPGQEGFQIIVQVANMAIATSGNYRKFYEKNGVKYSHSINPKTGYPVDHSLLSATVLAKDCISADGYATAFMVMGVDNTKDFLLNHPELNLEVYLVSSNSSGNYDVWMTNGFKRLINS